MIHEYQDYKLNNKLVIYLYVGVEEEKTSPLFNVGVQTFLRY